jgi:hypothetical protein
MTMKHVAIDRIGKVYGRLKVIGRAGTNRYGQALWLCQCSCPSGEQVIARGNHLATGQVKSCGCLRTEIALAAAKHFHYVKHGSARRDRKTPEYISYCSAKNRCENPNNSVYPSYGGRGIKFLYSSFDEFLRDVGPRPPKRTIERIDNNGHYQPGNCYWASHLVQANNKRNNRLLSALGKTQTLAQWAREYGINVTTLYCRLDRGIPLTRALGSGKYERSQVDTDQAS